MDDKLMETLEALAKEISSLKREVTDLKRREIPAGIWKTYTPSSQTGWTALPSGTYRYTAIGKLVILHIAMSGGNTSNATTAKIALPFTAANFGGGMTGANGYCIDNGAALTTMSRWAIAPNSTTIDFYKDAAVGAWTASGTKRISCVAIYERA